MCGVQPVTHVSGLENLASGGRGVLSILLNLHGFLASADGYLRS